MKHEIKLCPSCAAADHSRHQYDYMDRHGNVNLCRCSVCKLDELRRNVGDSIQCEYCGDRLGHGDLPCPNMR